MTPPTPADLDFRQNIRRDVKGFKKATLIQTTSIVELRTACLKKIQAYRETQRIVMPGFVWENHAQAADVSTDGGRYGHPEESKLFMPSELSVVDRRKYCPPELAELEERVRWAEAIDALEDMRNHLRTRSFSNSFKKANITGQIRNSRAREVQARIDDKVRAAELRYRRARGAYMTLHGPGDWEIVLKPLDKSDVRALNERERTAQEVHEQEKLRSRLGLGLDPTSTIAEGRVQAQTSTIGEGSRRPSWIWYNGVGHEKIGDDISKKGKLLR